MEIKESDVFSYKDKVLYCENINTLDLAEKFGTPLYIYSKKFFVDRYKEFTNAFESIPHKIFFASKSNFNLNVIKTFYDLGAGIDVNSEGEFIRALKAGVSPKHMLLTGVGKTKYEIEFGILNDVHLIKAESFEELEQINSIAESFNKKVNIAIRINPDIDALTHPYISTGLAENKFGIASEEAVRIFNEASKMSNLIPTGIDMHIGSQITSISPYKEAISKLAEIYKEINSQDNISLSHFDIGGGMGVVYNNEERFSVNHFAEEIIPILKKLNTKVYFEPGRSLTANGGLLITEVLYNKNNGHKNFVVVDSSMTDLLRPSLYKAYHHIQPVKLETEDCIVADIVGPVCESGDYLAKDRKLSCVKNGDMLAILSSGAYGMVMASNYNARRRGAEIIVDNDNFFVVRSRETFEHLIYDEEIVEKLHNK